LEEVTGADVIVHVRDIANPDIDAQKRQVLEVLAELGLFADAEEGGEPVVPIIEVWNKWDLLGQQRRDELKEAIVARPDETIVPVSSLTGEGCDALLDRLGHMLTADARICTFVLPASDGQKIAFLHARGDVLKEESLNDASGQAEIRLTVRLSERELGRFSAL
jgi:GTP-binding protein HflX